MHSVSVGVEVGGKGVMVLVVEGVKLGVAEMVMVRVAESCAVVSIAMKEADGCGVTGAAVVSASCVGIRSQAWIRIITIKNTIILRHTQAVYHNKPQLRSRLSLSEYRLATNQIQAFAGKIARVFYYWRSECVSLSL
jgi:hypothetical protein